jgi:1-deoxy-D-xylulose-5-phosphate synthase
MIPNMAVGAPADATELCAMIETAVDHDGPIASRYPKGGAASIPSLPVQPIVVGEAELLSGGDDVMLIAIGRMVEVAEKVAVDLRQKDASVGVINARWVKPLDPRIKEWAASARHIVTLEDNVLAGGFGAAILESFADAGMVKDVTCIGVPDEFLPFGAPGDVMEWAGMDPDSVIRRVEAVLEA